ncbi:hypothetical protein [Desulfobacula sp.]|nr:hypothetical protein [Desulfobacula sp.]
MFDNRTIKTCKLIEFFMDVSNVQSIAVSWANAFLDFLVILFQYG